MSSIRTEPVIRLHRLTVVTVTDEAQIGRNGKECEMAPESIVAKAQKIKRLLDGATTDGEAAAAAEALTRLMTKHHIEEYQLTGKVASEVRTANFDLGVGGRPNWRRNLFGIIARANGCETLFYTKTNRMVIVGRQTQIDIVYDLYTRLRMAILSIAKKEYKAHCEEIARHNESTVWWPLKPEHGPVWNHSFCMGANATLRKRLREARTGDTTEETAIVQVMDAEVTDAYKTQFPNLVTNDAPFNLSQSGWRAGSTAGGNLNLGKSVSSGSGRKALG